MTTEHTDHFSRPFKVFSDMPQSVRSDANIHGTDGAKVQSYLKQRAVHNQDIAFHQVIEVRKAGECCTRIL